MKGTISQTQANVMGKTESKSSISGFAVVCIIFNFLLIVAFALHKYFKESGEEFLTVSLFFGVVLLLFILSFLLLIVAVGYFSLRFRSNIKRAAFPLLPFLISITIFLTFWVGPIPTIWSDLKFRLKMDSYRRVVQMVEDGHIQPNNKGFSDLGFADLPPEYRHLSRGGDIFIDKRGKVTTVLFHTSSKNKLSSDNALTRLVRLSGYMYRSDGKSPPQYFQGLDWVHVKEIEPNWFYYYSKIVYEYP